jgi:hypothetical protein
LFLGNAVQLQALVEAGNPHAATRRDRLMQLARSEPGVVIESMKDGVHLRSLESPLASDSFVVLRPMLSGEEVTKGLARCLAHEGKPYDFDFDFRRADRLVCTEVVYRAFDGIGSIRLPLTRRAGRLNLSGGDLLEMTMRGEHFRPVAAYAPGLKPGFVMGEATADVLAAAARRVPEPQAPTCRAKLQPTGDELQQGNCR